MAVADLTSPHREGRGCRLEGLPADPLVSVVTVCLDETRERIERTLESIERQSYPRIERVIVDGGSKAETLAALQALGASVDRMLSEADRGVMDAMNKGVGLARGDLIAFMNIGDRYAGPEVVERLVGALRAYPAPAFSYGDFVRRRADGRADLVRTPRVSRCSLYRGALCQQTVLARHELFHLVGAFDESMEALSDMDWFARLVQAGFGGVHAGVVVCEYEAGGTSVRDLRRYYRAFAHYRRRHFTLPERTAYGIAALAIRAAGRLRSRDFSLPARVQMLLGPGGG